jgi:hypothetical protein
LLATPVASLLSAPGAGACTFSPTAVIFPSSPGGAVSSGGVLYDQYDDGCASATGS